MTGLSDVYERQVGLAVSRRRLYLGLGLFLSGALLTAAGVVLAATGLRSALGLEQMPAWRRAGVLAGLGVPAVIGGVFTILPSSDRVKAAATVGAGVSMLGVALFWYAYPTHWAGYGQNLTLPVTVVYFLGMTTSVWCLFVGIANFKRRNDPGGTITLEVLVGDGESQTVEVSADDVGPDGTVDLQASETGGSVGLFGGTPDTSVETQTNTPGSGSSGDGATVTSSSSSASTASTNGSAPTTDGSTGRSASGGSTGYDSGGPGGAGDAASAGSDPHLKGGDVGRGGTASAGTDTAAPTDGGREGNGLTTPKGSGGGQVLSADEHAKEVADRYCGNCEHFQYVRTDDGMQPYCGFHAEEMDDMEACDEWSPNH